MRTTFYPSGVCSKQYDILLEDGTIRDLSITGGCSGNLSFLSRLVTGKKAEEVIPLLRGIPCGSRSTSCPDQISLALEEALRAEEEEKSSHARLCSSSLDIDMDKEFLYQNFRYLRRENSPVFGVSSPDEVVLQPLCFDELCYLLSAEGTHLILFGGFWSTATCSIVDQVNYYARKYGVDTVYLYDFSPDGTEGANIKQDISAQPAYEGPDKKASNDFAVYNYLYGELAVRHLTNLNDWVAGKAGAPGDITYLNLYQDAVAVPNLREPFLFLYNKDNTADHSGAAHESSSGGESRTYPIVWAAELEAYRDGLDGCLYSSPTVHNESTLISDFGALLEERIFRHIGEEGTVITPYTHADYIREAFSRNERGHSFKTQDAFGKDEQINIQMIPFQELHWLVRQKGSFLILLAGPWCAYSQGCIATVNDYAVANHVRVYMSDIRLDSKHAIDFWKYPRKNELTLSCPPFMKYYVELWEQYFRRAQLICSLDPERPWGKLTKSYTDESGKEHTVLAVGIPFLLAYNKDHVDPNGRISPILASRHDAYELINCSDEFIYYEPNYKDYKSSVYRVFYAYMDSLGEKTREIAIDRSAPKVEGQPVRHKETVAYHKDHDWFRERADRAEAVPASGCCEEC